MDRDGFEYPEAWSDRFALRMRLLDKIRMRHGRSIKVVSGIRSAARNHRLLIESAKRNDGKHQVATDSTHVSGEAADIADAAGESPSILYREIVALYEGGKLEELGGIGLYPTSGWVHVDTRKARDGHLRKWWGK